MPCIWRNTVNAVVRVATCPRPVFCPRNTRFLCSYSLAARSSKDKLVACAPGIWKRPFGAQKAPYDSPECDLTSQAALLSDSQLSRAAAQAIRMSFAESDWQSAFYLLKSMRSAGHPQSHVTNQPKSRLFPPPFNPVTFGRPVKYRLAAHALVHALLRAGMSRRAADTTQWMMKQGIHVRSATFEAAVKAQLPQSGDPKFRNWEFKLDPTRIDNNTRVLRLRSNMVSSQSTRFAINLLLQARRSRQQRTQNIWDWLIHTCLLQGEIIVGTLLFTILVEDLALKRILASKLLAQQQRVAQNAPPENPAIIKEMEAEYRSYGQAIPRNKLLHSLTGAIRDIISYGPDKDPHVFHGALQGLANLAWLLNHRKLSFPEIAPLIRAMYSCPPVEDQVWVYDRGKATRVGVYAYCHSVLKGLINDLPCKPMSERRSQIAQKHAPRLSSLDLDACNSLLHYALRHRLSPVLANRVLSYMTAERHKPLQPDITTYNILIRSGTLLRKNQLAEDVLEALRKYDKNERHIIQLNPSDQVPASKQGASEPLIIPFPHSRYSQALHRVYNEDIFLPAAMTNVKQPLLADSHTLTAYITHITSTNNHHIISAILFRLLPELLFIDHPSYTSLTVEEQHELRVRGREQALRKAVLYGPWIFCALLNALRKAGKTGLAERVWLLAKEAERASWLSQFWSESQKISGDADGAADGASMDEIRGLTGDQSAAAPWCLPVHAYTVMLQCYASEANRSLSLYRRRRSVVEVQDLPEWKPRTEKRLVRGWAKWFLLQQAHNKRDRSQMNRERMSRSYMARRMSIELVRVMRQASRDIYDSLLEIQRRSQNLSLQHKYLNIPRPDARFFNAALSMYTRHHSAFVPRRRHASRVRWRRRLRRTHYGYAREGKLSHYWHPWLQEIVEGMVETGFEVPVSVRCAAVGRGIYGISQTKREVAFEGRPFAFPGTKGRTKFLPHALRTWKDRGLPRMTEHKHYWPWRRRRYQAVVLNGTK